MKNKFPLITISVLISMVIIVLLINNYGSDNVKIYSAFTALSILLLSMLVFVVCAVRKVIKNEKRYKKFRKELKVGDMIDEGTVLDIEGDVVTIVKTCKLEFIYPPRSNDDTINLI